MDTKLYLLLSGMMFLEFAIWGAWAPILASHLLGPLKMSGKQTGWIYSTLWMGCILAPFVGGQIADLWIPTDDFLVLVHLAGGVVLLLAAKQRTFAGLFSYMGIYALLYAPTLALVNSLMMTHLTDSSTQAGGIRVWGTIGWIVAGVSVALWRHSGKLKIRGSDALTLAGILSLAMGIYCFFLPHTPPPGESTSMSGAALWAMLKDPNLLIFLLISFIVTTELQFYYVPTAPFLEDIGVKHKNVSAVMAIAQVAEIIAMVWLLKLSLDHWGYRWTLAIGVLAWPMRYFIFALMKPMWLVISSLTFHGLGYTFFFFAGQMYVNEVAPPELIASAQGLIIVVTLGLGNFIGTQFTGVIMDYFKKDDRFRWRPIFLVPCVLTVVCAVAFLLFFKG